MERDLTDMDGPTIKDREPSDSSDFSLPPHPLEEGASRSPPVRPPGAGNESPQANDSAEGLPDQSQTQFRPILPNPVSHVEPVIGPYVQQPIVTQAPTGQQTITEATTSVTSVPSVTQQLPLPNTGYGPPVPISEAKGRPLQEAKTYRPPTPRREDSLIPNSAVTPVVQAQPITRANPATFSAVSGIVPGSQNQAIRQAASSGALTTNNMNPEQQVHQQQGTTGDLSLIHI